MTYKIEIVKIIKTSQEPHINTLYTQTFDHLNIPQVVEAINKICQCVEDEYGTPVVKSLKEITAVLKEVKERY
jgi:hypothetical protein